MAVVKNFWLKDNTQKLGGAVIYQVNGQTLMRQLAPAVSNPRTDAQMSTRVRLANLVAFYRASAGWMKGAFESKAANQSDYNAFVSANATANAVWLTKSQVEAGTCIVGPYTISRGSMGEIKQTATATMITSNLYVGELTITAATTIGELSTALITNNNGLQNGDQLSVIQYIQNTGSAGAYTTTCRAREMLLNTSSVELVSRFLPVEILGVSTGETPALSILTSSFVGGAAFVLSRTQGGRILVTTSSVTLTYGNSVYNAMTSATQKENAVRSYGTNTVVFLDSNVVAAANEGIPTAASIASVVIGSRTYAAGSYLPESLPASSQVIINLTAPVELSQAATLTITRDGNQSALTSLTSSETSGEVMQLTFPTSSKVNIPRGSSDYTYIFAVSTGTALLSINLKREGSADSGEGLGGN